MSGALSFAARARVAGLLYLLSLLARIFADGMVRDRLVVSRDAARTAANLVANETLFRWGIFADMVAFASFVLLAAIFYDLFKHYSRTASLAAAFVSLISSAVQAVSVVFHMVALWLITDAANFPAFTTAQVQELALIALRARATTYQYVGLVFLGLYCLILGVMVVRSRIIPAAVGALMVLAGASYLLFAWPPLANSLKPYILAPPGIGQIVFTLWLIVFGAKNRMSEAVVHHREAA